MNGLPKSFLFVVAFVLLAAVLIVYFLSKQILFRRHKRKGEEALQRRDYLAAIESFGRAEALWELNVTKQTGLSYEFDLTTLNELLNGLEEAARAKGIALAVPEYREAVQAIQAELRDNKAGNCAGSSKAYASAFMRLKNARSVIREQLRAAVSPESVKGNRLG